MTFKHNLDSWLWGNARFPKRPERSIRAHIAVRKRFGDVQPVEPPERDLDGLLERVWDHFERNSLATLPLRDKKLLPWVLFYPPGKDGTWLGRDARFTEEAISLLAQAKPGVLGALVTVLLKCYPDCSSLIQQFVIVALILF